MSHNISPGSAVSERENPQQCDFCGKIAELRPYGPNEEVICIECAKKDPKTTEKMMGRVLFKDDV